MPNGDYAAVVQKLRPEAAEPGEIVDMARPRARPPRRHRPLHRRPAPRPGARRPRRTDNEPLYVVRLEPETRRVVVGPRAALGRSEIALYDVNWLGPEHRRRAAGAGAGALLARRCGRPKSSARPTARIVRFAEPEIGVSPGQACVVYDAANGSRVLGGGFIRRFAS